MYGKVYIGMKYAGIVGPDFKIYAEGECNESLHDGRGLKDNRLFAEDGNKVHRQRASEGVPSTSEQG